MQASLVGLKKVGSVLEMGFRLRTGVVEIQRINYVDAKPLLRRLKVEERHILDGTVRHFPEELRSVQISVTKKWWFWEEVAFLGFEVDYPQKPEAPAGE